MIDYIQKHIAWSKATFGPGTRTVGLIAHIKKELNEIEANPRDLEEWCDVMILAMDGAWRAGFTAEEIVLALEAKQALNATRTWPRTTEDAPSEHDRSKDV